MKWEYSVIEIDSNGYCRHGWDEKEDKPRWMHIDELGKYEWELVSVCRDDSVTYLAFFKRSLPIEVK